MGFFDVLRKKEKITPDDIEKATELTTKTVENLFERTKLNGEIKELKKRQVEIIKGMEAGTISEEDVIAYIKALTSAGTRGIELEAERLKLEKEFEINE